MIKSFLYGAPITSLIGLGIVGMLYYPAQVGYVVGAIGFVCISLLFGGIIRGKI